MQCKKSRNTVQQAQFLPSIQRVVLLWCTHTLGFTEFPVGDVNSQGFNVLLSVHHFVRNLLWHKKAVTFFNFWAFFNALSHRQSRVACASHQAVAIKAGQCCVLVCIFSILACIVLAVA
jgi:hypothetical protein